MRQEAAPPGVFRLVSDPVRWRLLAELADSDRQVRELESLTGLRQSLVSYHLGQLRAGGLVSMRRSSADRRDAYYSIDLARCHELLAAAGTSLHPGLRLVPAASVASVATARVLFLCTGNSARSQIAEAWLEHLSFGSVEAASAGSHPKALNPDAVRAMREYGIDIGENQAKHLDTFAGQRFDYVISLCDRVREVCPEFPGHPTMIHWSIPDPAGDEQGYEAFRQVAADLRSRIGFLLARLSGGYGSGGQGDGDPDGSGGEEGEDYAPA
jgi:ArsR family transcriptional regulator, arsenate/arsenite/antimonite-responsive transcriptional repressor / arsenate reductase (thioredoxin)